MGRSSRQPDLDQLVIEHLPAALRFAVRLTGDPDAAEEIVQEALTRVAAAWGSLRGEAEFRTWLFRIVINVFRDRQRTRSKLRPFLGDVEDSRSDQPESMAMAAELGLLIADRIRALPPRQREVLVLHVYEYLSVGEVAELLQITEANVYSTLHLARQRLREELADYLVEK